MRHLLLETTLLARLARLNGQPPSSGPVPYTFMLDRLAARWGVPPWVLTGEQPTPDVVQRWITRGRIFMSME